MLADTKKKNPCFRVWDFYAFILYFTLSFTIFLYFMRSYRKYIYIPIYNIPAAAAMTHNNNNNKPPGL